MKSKTVKRGARLKTLLASLAALTLGFGQLVLGSSPANAADISGQLNVVSLVVEGEDQATATWGEQYQAKAVVVVPDSANPGDTWTWNLPEQINWPAGFNIDIGGQTVVNVSIENNVATFALTDAGANTNSLRVNFEFGGQLSHSVGPGDYDLNITQLGTVIATKHISVRKAPFHDLPTYDWKQMWFNGEQCRTDTAQCITAAITLKAGDRGMVTVTDLAKPNWNFACDTLELTLRDHNAETETPANNAILNKECSPTSLKFNVNTSVIPAHQSYRMTIDLNALVASETGLVTYENNATILDKNGPTEIETSAQSAYVGGFADGAHIKIRKTDAAGNDANSQDAGVEIPGGKTKLVYTIINNGTQNLTNVEVSDRVLVGNAKVTNLDCVFPGGARGTTWDGPFEPKASFTCTADLNGVSGHHHNIGTVAALSATGTPISAEDPYWARNKQKVKVGNQVWFDANGDGLFQEGQEEGIDGVTLTISRTDGAQVTDYAGGAYTTAIQSANGGKYLFENLPTLPAGVKYEVTISNVPAEYTPTKADVGGAEGIDNNSSTTKATSTDLTTNGAEDLTLDFGFVKNKKVAIGNQVWFDADKNGLFDNNEQGIENVKLTVTRTDGNPVTNYRGEELTDDQRSTRTTADGQYLFVDLAALPADVKYVVTVSEVPAQYEPTKADVGGAEGVDNNSSTGTATSIALTTNGAQDLTLDFGFIEKPKVSIGNQVWFDADKNGLFDNNEQGIENVKLTVTRSDNNPVTNFKGEELTEDQRSTKTNAQGQYMFENLAVLPAGTKYIVTVSEVPAQYEPTKADVGGAEGVDNNSSTGTATSTDLTTDGAQDLTLDFGFIEKPKVSIGNQVWFDADNNGLFDNGEKGLENIKLTVTRSDNNPVTNFKGEELTEDQRSTKTNAQGQYMFENLAVLPAGTKYIVTVSEVPAQYEPTKADVGGAEGVDNNSSTGTATSTDLTTDGAQDLTLDFGFVYKKVSIGNQVWFDKDNDGLFNNNEKGIANAELTVTRTDGQPVVDFKGQPYNVKTTTNADGQYLFADLSVLPADVKYVVTIADIPGYLPTKADVGGVEGVDNNSSTGTATSTALVDNNAADLTLDFGFVKKKVSVGDYVWWDVNRDGQQSDDEKPVSDVTVKLFNEAGEEIGTTKTDENGFYSFVDLEAGDKYTVKFIAPEGASFTTQEEGDEATDSNPNLDGVAEFTAPLDGQNKADKPDLPTIDAGIVKLNLVLVKKLETTELVYPGDEVVFTLTPSNEGPVDALAGWSVTDVLPAGLTLVDISGEGYTCDKETATCIAADILAAGETGNAITVKAKVDADVKGSLHNVAYVAPAPEEIVETNPLGDKPVTGTNTDETSTDNDSQALLKVIEVIVPEKPGLAKTGGDMPLVGAGVAAMLLAAGGALVAARRSKRA